MTNSLDIAPQQAGDLYDDLGAAFGVDDREWMGVKAGTVGEMEAWLRGRLGEEADTVGASTAIFLRLRAVLPGGERLRPSALLADLTEGEPRRLFRRLQKATGLTLPASPLSRRGFAASAVLFAALPLGLLINHFAPRDWLAFGSLLAWPLMVAVMTADRGRLPEGVRTLGELARAAVAYNHGKALHGGEAPPAGLWEALTRVIATSLNVPRESIGRETRLFATVH